MFVNARFSGSDREGFGPHLLPHPHPVLRDIFIKMPYIKNKKPVGLIAYMSNKSHNKISFIMESYIQNIKSR